MWRPIHHGCLKCPLHINWWQVGLDALIGGISGSLGASPIPHITSIILGGILGAVGSLGGTVIASNDDLASIDWGIAIASAIFMGGVGALLGRWTGAGATNIKVMTGYHGVVRHF